MIVFATGFDHIGSNAELGQDGWITEFIVGGGISTARARTGTRSVVVGTSQSRFRRTIAPLPALYLGFGMFIDTVPTGNLNIVSLNEGGTVHLWLRIDASARLSVLAAGSGTPLFTTTLSEPLQTWSYYELYASIHDTTGAYTLRRNEQLVDAKTNIDTRNAGSGVIDEIRFGDNFAAGPSSTRYFDDLYLCDTVAPNNSFLGQVRLRQLVPNADDAVAWTRSAGALNYANVDDGVPNEDTDYNAATASGLTDKFAMTDLPATVAAVKGVVVRARTRKTDSGASTYRIGVESAAGGAPATLSESADISPDQSYRWDSLIADTDPDTGAAWTKAGVDAMKCQVRRTS
jgi:hypothetical protein